MRPLFLGYDAVRGFDTVLRRGDRVALDAESLVRHAFVCGTIGSGKTVFAKGMVEEAVLAGIPVIAVDFKGDLSSLALHGRLASLPALRRLFRDQGEAVHAEFVAGLAQNRAVQEGAQSFDQRAQVRLFTPIAPIASRVALAGLPSFPDPVEDELEKAERDELVAALVRGFAVTMYGSEGSVKRNEASVKLLEEIVRWCNERGEPLEGPQGIAKVLQLVQTPPFEAIGGLPINKYVPNKQRDLLLSGLNGRISGAERARYEGPRLSVETLLEGTEPGRVPLSVLYLGHISAFFDQALVLGQLCADIYRWMRKTGGSDKLRLLLYIDELGGGDNKEAFYPSYPHNPPSKGPLNLLVKQGRSAGVGVLLATQNPMSVDVRGLGNVNTWALGKLTQRNDQDRVKDILDQFPQGRERALAEVSQLPTGAFLTLSDGLVGPRIVWERWLYSVHRQLSPAQVREIHAMQRETLSGDESGQTPSLQGETMTLPLLVEVQWVLLQGEKRWTIPVGGSVVGRSSGAAIQLEDPHISRLHLELVPDGPALLVRVLQTKNPTRLDGRVLQGEMRIEAGTRALLELGSTQLEVVAIPAQTVPGQATRLG